MTAVALRRQVDELACAIRARQTPARIWATPVELAAALELGLDPWQARILGSTARRVIVLGPRQSGKSTVSALLSLHVALTTPDALALVIAPAQRQSQELARVVRHLAARLGVAATEAAAPSAVSASRLEFANGARVIALPGATEATVRGYAKPDLVVVDEASRLPEETFAAVRPMLVASPAGRLVLVSTPWLKSGTFFRAWVGDSAAWERHRVRLEDCPRLSSDFLDEERASLPSWVYAREYLGEFAADDTTVFTAELIQAALDPAVRPLFAAEGAAA